MIFPVENRPARSTMQPAAKARYLCTVQAATSPAPKITI